MQTLIYGLAISVLTSSVAMACSTPGPDASDPLIDAGLETILHSNFNCFGDNASNRSACNFFVGKSVQDFYGVSDFWMTDKNRFMTTAEMVDWMPGNTPLLTWTRLGTAAEPTAHQAASDAAHSGRATIALWNPSGGIGHVALVLPGELRRSGTWGMDVVRVAQTQLDNVGKAFVGCHIGHGFGTDKKAEIVFWTK